MTTKTRRDDVQAGYGHSDDPVPAPGGTESVSGGQESEDKEKDVSGRGIWLALR